MAARQAPSDVARRRQAIYLGLMANLEEAQAQVALRIWDSGYAPSRSTAIIDFVAEIAARLKLPPKQRHEVRMGLYQALLRYDAGREPPPIEAPSVGPIAKPAPADGTAAAGAADSGASAAYVVFAAMAEHILGGVRADGPVAMDDFARSLDTQSFAADPRGADRPVLMSWLRGQGTLTAFAKASEDHFSLLVHGLYVAAAEALGPVAADRLLAQAVTHAEPLREARRFPPRRLL